MTQAVGHVPVERASHAMPRRPSLALIGLAMLLLQCVWILAVPPFGATDEFDHAYRAASVARGEWRVESTDATRGTGAVVTVPDDIVKAARPECERLPYTKEGDCVGVSTAAGTEVATGAGRYHPLYYFLVGTPALPFDGTTALYVMRAASSLLSWVVLLGAFVAIRRWATTPWPYLTLAVACSPVAWFSFSMAAPNGLEIAAATGLWAALLGLLRSERVASEGTLLAVGTLSACLLVSVRSLGPLWALLVLLATLAATSDRRAVLVRLVRQRRVQLSAGLVFVVTMASLAWILSTGSLVIGKLPEPPTLTASERATTLAKSLAQWVFQSIGAFPFRNVPAPSVVYLTYLFLVTWLMIFALRGSQRAERRTMVAVMVLSLVIPLGLTVATLDEFGFSWQGRYTLPFSMGFILLAGAALDRRGRRPHPATLALGGVLFAIAQGVSPASVTATERLTSPGVDNGAWLVVAPWLVAVLGALAAGLLWFAASGTDLRRARPPEELV